MRIAFFDLAPSDPRNLISKSKTLVSPGDLSNWFSKLRKTFVTLDQSNLSLQGGTYQSCTGMYPESCTTGTTLGIDGSVKAYSTWYSPANEVFYVVADSTLSLQLIVYRISNSQLSRCSHRTKPVRDGRHNANRVIR